MGIKRIYKKKFQFYLFLISLPAFLFGLALMIDPAAVVPYIFAEGEAAAALASPLTLRGTGLFFFYFSFTILISRSSPDSYRSQIMWQALFSFALAAFFAAAPFLFALPWYLLAAALWFVGSGILLFLYASRNLLLRE